jgi:RHS repeat-associated protein
MRLLAACLVVLSCLLAPICWAQDVYDQINVGTPPNGLFHGGEIDTVQLNNGNLHIEIPLWTVRGRGPVPVGAIFVLDTMEWSYKVSTNRQTGDTTAIIRTELNGTFGGLVRSLAYSRTSATAHAQTVSCPPYSSNYVIAEANGTKHHLVPDPGDGCPAILSWNFYYADDGSGLSFNSTSGVVAKNGIQVGGADTNGNTPDTLGRSFPAGYLTYFDDAGNAQTIQVTYTNVPVSTHLCQFVDGVDACQEYTGLKSEVSQIKLANGMTYNISYVQNDEGEPSSLTLPSGAQISWTYNSGNSGGPTVATRTVTANGHSSTWNYNGNVTDPLGNEIDLTYTVFTRYAGNPPYNANIFPLGYVTTKQFKDNSSGSLVLVKTETTDYSTSIGPVLPIRVTTTWNQPNQVSKVETDYDSFTNSNISGFTFSATNPIAKREYDWGTGAPGNLLRRAAFNYLHLTSSTYLNANILDRITSKTVYDSTSNTCKGVSQACAQTTYSYDSTAITSTSSTPAPNHDYTGHGYTFTTRGNVTQTSRWLNSNGTWLSTTNVYDDLGNLRSTTDPKGNVTSFSYTDNFTDGINRNAQAFATQITHPVTSGVNHIEKRQFFYWTSLVAASCGQNFPSACVNTVSPPQPDYVKLTYDNMFRPLTITRGDGGTTTASYNDLTLPLSVTATSSITGSLSKTSTGVFDDLYRIKQTQLTSDQQGTVFADTSYDAFGRKSTVTNPHRSGSSPTDGTSTYFYDGLGRSCLVVPPDGTLPSGGVLCPSTRPTGDSQTIYSGNTVTVTDQAGKSRKSVSDGLGHLTQVFEDPAGLNYETDYQYDTLDNLSRVDQKGGDPNSANWRTRTFAYDSLSRLLCAANPEIQIVTCPNTDNGSYTAGTTRYTYDSNGNVLTKKSPKPNQTSASVTVTATFAYDALNRILSKSFDNGDPTINYAYDAVSPIGCTPGSFSYGNAIGKRTAMCDAAGMELWGYSITSGVGWLTADQRTTNSVTKTTSYQNNLAGLLATLTYPSGRVVTYTQDGAGRTSKAIDVANSINYVTGTCANGTDNLGVCYTPPGSFSSLTNGSSLVSTSYYNDRLQPCRVSVKSSGTAPAACTDTATGNVLDFAYNFSRGSADNSNVAKITNNRDTSRSINYGYDNLNRIAYAYTDGNLWGETYQIDAWGNLNKILAYTGKPQPENLNQTAGPNNRFTGMLYDAVGNLLNDGLSNYVFDAENHINTGAGVTYTYDGDGRRVKKSSGKLYWYGTGADPLDETDLSGNTNNSTFNEYVFFNGKRIARRDSSNNVFYYVSDHLGTSRAMLQSGQSTPCYDADFYPYGVERTPVVNSCPQNYKFTAKERDSESGLDNVGARHKSSALGRFIVPDLKLATERHVESPQKWNKYAYVQNNPQLRVDLDGLDDYVVFRLASDFRGGDAVVGTHAQTWKAVEKTITSQKDSKGNPNTFHMVEGAQATVEAFNKALATPDTHVIFVGHATETNEGTTNGIRLYDGNSYGNQGSQTDTFSTSEDSTISQERLNYNDPGPINASSVDLFACGTESLTSQYDNTDFAGVQSGPGGTMTDTLDLAAAAFVLAGGGQAGADAANTVIENSPHALDTGSNVVETKPQEAPPQN